MFLSKPSSEEISKRDLCLFVVVVAFIFIKRKEAIVVFNLIFLSVVLNSEMIFDISNLRVLHVSRISEKNPSFRTSDWFTGLLCI